MTSAAQVLLIIYVATLLLDMSLITQLTVFVITKVVYSRVVTPCFRYWDDDGMCDFWQDTQRDSHFFNTGLQAQRTRAIQVNYYKG